MSKAPLIKNFKIFQQKILKLKLKFFVISKRYCSRFSLDNILLSLHVRTSQNINLFKLKQRCIFIQILSHQPGLKLAGYLLEGNKTS